jgi:hypothetical protein
MNRLSLLLLLLVLIQSWYVRAAEPASSWFLLMRYDSGNETYYDTTPRTYGDFRVVRLLRNLAASGGSWVSDIAVDCSTRTATTLKQVQYSGQMGTGEQSRMMMVDERTWRDKPWPTWDRFVLPPELRFTSLAAEACAVPRDRQ